VRGSSARGQRKRCPLERTLSSASSLPDVFRSDGRDVKALRSSLWSVSSFEEDISSWCYVWFNLKWMCDARSFARATRNLICARSSPHSQYTISVTPFTDMEAIDMDRLKTGEVNLGVRLLSSRCAAHSTDRPCWTDLNHGRSIRWRRNCRCRQSDDNRKLHRASHPLQTHLSERHSLS
jgi:hypothetical protein